ncbi:hypothetical protein WJX81_005707 [Elliptochloris bilobata]|uniref:Uncharacterized protein n=1 Tax=Elliptochloris bilobata TaxID=381761 RepID=A0AAW1QZZ9_9CHLO
MAEGAKLKSTGEYTVTWRQALTMPAWETTFTVSIGAERAKNDVAPGFAVAALVADTHKSYVQTYDVDGKPADRSFHLVTHCDDTLY